MKRFRYGRWNRRWKRHWRRSRKRDNYLSLFVVATVLLFHFGRYAGGWLQRQLAASGKKEKSRPAHEVRRVRHPAAAPPQPARPARRKPAAQGAPPDPAALSPWALRRWVARRTLKHPGTLIPLVMAGFSALGAGLSYLVASSSAVLPSITGLEGAAGPLVAGLATGAAFVAPWLLAATLGFGGLAAAVWLFNNLVRGEKLALRRVDTLAAEKRTHLLHDLRALEADWEGLELTAGRQRTRRLISAVERLERALHQRAGDPATIPFQLLSEDACQDGLEVLRAALTTAHRLRRIDPDACRREIDTYQRKLELLQSGTGDTDGTASARQIDPLEKRLKASRQRLQRYDEDLERLDRQLTASQPLEAAVETAYLSLVSGQKSPKPRVVEPSPAPAQRRRKRSGRTRRRVRQALKEG